MENTVILSQQSPKSQLGTSISSNVQWAMSSENHLSCIPVVFKAWFVPRQISLWLCSQKQTYCVLPKHRAGAGMLQTLLHEQGWRTIAEGLRQRIARTLKTERCYWGSCSVFQTLLCCRLSSPSLGCSCVSVCSSHGLEDRNIPVAAAAAAFSVLGTLLQHLPWVWCCHLKASVATDTCLSPSMEWP